MRTELVVVAQARPIAGRKKDAHVCTILFDPADSLLYRTRFPLGSAPRRWDFVAANLYLSSEDRRRESRQVTDVEKLKQLKTSEKTEVHRKLLNMALTEQEAIDGKLSINVSKISAVKLGAHTWNDGKDQRMIQNARRKGINIAPKKLKVICTPLYSHTTPNFHKTYLEWGANHRLIREGPSIIPELKHTISSIKHPYLITGTHYRHTKSFMAIAVMASTFAYVSGEQKSLFD